MTFKQFFLESKLESKKITFLPHLKDVIKQGKDIVENILTSHLIISEKKDGSKFSIIKTSDGEVEYWSKNVKLDKPFLIANKNWSKLIDRLEVLRKKTKNFSKLPNNSEVSGEFIQSVDHNTVAYQKLPKGNWVVYFANINGTEYNVPQYQELHEISDYFESEKEPILFDGKLSEEQKNKLFEFLDLSDEERIKKFKTENFTQFIISIIKPDYEPLLGQKMEGIVLYVKGQELPINIVKIVDPTFTEINRERWDKNKVKIEEFKRELIGFILKNTPISLIKKYKKDFSEMLSGMKEDEKYVFLIDRLLTHYGTKKKVELDEIRNKFKELANIENVYINKDLIGNESKYTINKDWLSRELYLLMLIALRREKKKRSEMFKNVDLEQFNSIVRAFYEL